MKTGTKTDLNSTGKRVSHIDKAIEYKGNWIVTESGEFESASSSTKGDSFNMKFNGTQIGIYGISNPVGGYANVVLTNSKGKVIVSAIVDAYSKYEVKSLLFLTPVLKKGSYTLTVTVRGHHGSWSDKRKNNYGSTDNYVSLNSVIINE